MSGLFFYTGAAGFSIGVFLRSLYSFPKEAVLISLILSFTLAILWRRKQLPYVSLMFCMSVFFLFFSMGLFRVELSQWHDSSFDTYEGEEVVLEGVVVREPDVRESTQHLYVKVEGSEERILVTADRFIEVSYGDVVHVAGEVTQPESFETDLGRTFNYPGYLRARGVEYAMFFAEVEVVAHGEGNIIIASLLSLKHFFMDALEMFVPEPAAGLGEGLLLGVKRALGENLEEAFRRTGIIHIVVLSGYNVMIVAEAIMRLLSFVFLPRTRLVIGIVAITSFALMVGLSATVVRASIMAVLVLIARASGRITAILRTLVFAGVVMIALNPYLIAFDPGFQLSFLATLGLILLAPHIEKTFRLVPTKYQIREFVVATIATQIMVLPLLLYLMGQFSVVAVLVNVLVLPMVPIAMGLSFATGVVGYVVPFLGTLVGFIAHLSLMYIVVIATFFSALPFAAFSVPAFPFWIAVLLYALLAFVLWELHRREQGTAVVSTDALDEWTIVELAEVKSEIQSRPDFSSEKSGRDAFPFR